MMHRRNLLQGVAAASLIARASVAQTLTDEQKSALKPANADPALAPDLLLPPKAMEWWRDAKFGVFVHWGLYAIPGKGEWHMFADKVPAAEYAKLAQDFDPRHYDPTSWARLAKDAGARYMVLTARHHDGFALWDSPASYGQFDAMHAAAHRDLVAPFVNAVRGEGLRVGLYYSPLDWRFPAYFRPRELPENAALFKQQTYRQVEELMSRYGKIDILWWDGGWLAHSGTDADAAWFWEPDKLNRMVRRYQPNIAINPRSGWQGDFDISEGPAAITGPIRQRPWEKTFSLSRAWGYTPDGDVMSSDQVVRMLVDAVVRNGNLLANVGPDRDGVIGRREVETLKAVGHWLEQYGAAIYGTRPGPLEPVDGLYGTTQSDGSVFLLILSWPSEELRIPRLPARVVKARNLSGGPVAWKTTEDGHTISVPESARGRPVTIIALQTA